MKKVIEFPVELDKKYRERFSFINKDTLIKGEEEGYDTFPCIVLVDTENKIEVAYTGYERFLISLKMSDVKRGTTLSKQAFWVCHFLNYLLKEERIDRVCDVTIDTIRNYAKYSKKKNDLEEYDPDTYERRLNAVFIFLKNYYEAYRYKYKFAYDGDELSHKEIIRDKENNKRIKKETDIKLYVKKPRKTHKKNRFLVYGYLALILYEAKKYDPMLALAIALQAYAGLREGEVVNLTCGRVRFPSGAFDTKTKIELDLKEKAPFWMDYAKKTPPGEFKRSKSISQNRTQTVYKDFVKEVRKMYDEHLAMLESKGYGTGEDDPLFVNKYGKPMTVQTYTGRVKKLFYNRFIPTLKRLCFEQNTLAENAAFIEVYEKEYPGAHMFRHWFTMYLLTKARNEDGSKLEPWQIKDLRNDSCSESIASYIHENSDFIDVYNKSAFNLQLSILEEIEKYEQELD